MIRTDGTPTIASAPRPPLPKYDAHLALPAGFVLERTGSHLWALSTPDGGLYVHYSEDAARQFARTWKERNW